MFGTTLPRSRICRTCAALCLSLALLIASAAPATGCSWDYLIWMPRDRDADALYRFVRGDKAGYIDRAGKVVIGPRFEFYGNHGGEFHGGLLEDGFRSGRYVDATGKAVAAGPLVGVRFSEGLTALLDKETGERGYVDRGGKFVISPRFPRGANAFDFSDGLARINTSDGYGFIDRSGEFVIKPAFLHAEDFREGMARVVVEGPCALYDGGPCPGFPVLGGGGGRATEDTPPCKFSFVDRRGSVLAARFDAARVFSEGLAPVSRGGKWGYIDKAGRFAVEPRFDEAWPFSEGRARVRLGDLYGFVDLRGELVVPARFGYADDFSEGLAAVGTLYSEEPGGVRYIDRGGRVRIPGPFHVASHFFKGLAHVELKPLVREKGGALWRTRRFAYIDAKARTVFAYEYEVED